MPPAPDAGPSRSSAASDRAVTLKVLIVSDRPDFRQLLAHHVTLEWRDAASIDWGTILLFAGGMSLGELMFSTGLAHWIGAGLAGVFQSNSVIGLTLLFAAVGIIVSETTTNTASATMVVPIAIAVSQAAGVDPLKPALAACLACSMGFLLPVSTGPNAMAYGTGCVPLRAMMRHGILLDVVGWVVIVTTVLLLGPTLPVPR